MHPTPYLFFNDGMCRDALEFYADVFGAEIGMISTFGEMPPSEEMAVPDAMRDHVMHGAITWPDGGLLMASDTLETDQPRMDRNSIHMALPGVDAARAAFDRLAEGGEVGMPFGPTFWAEGFGTVRDRFGTRWMIGTDDSA